VPKELNALTCTTDSAIIGHQMFFLNSIFALGGVQEGSSTPSLQPLHTFLFLLCTLGSISLSAY
jgi:hypothetical protein